MASVSLDDETEETDSEEETAQEPEVEEIEEGEEEVDLEGAISDEGVEIMEDLEEEGSEDSTEEESSKSLENSLENASENNEGEDPEQVEVDAEEDNLVGDAMQEGNDEQVIEAGASEEESTQGASSTEGQGTELNDENTKTNWEGFDEDFSSHNEIELPEDQHIKSHDVSELRDVKDYEGDGFRFHLLHPRNNESFIRSSAFGVTMALLAAFAVCVCLCRRLRGGRSNVPHRGKYAALHGSDDFFNGTFSDDISFRGKDSDDEMSENSYDSDEEGGLQLELGGIHELDANGGLTLDECNG